MPARRVEGFLPFREHEIWYRVTGDLGAGKPPLLLVHGGPGGASDYFEPLEALSEAGRPVVRYDQLGGGRSDRPSDPSLWTIETFVDELATVRRELGLDRIHLLGQSWGGTLAVEYALTRPTGVVSLVLHSTPVDWPLMASELERLRAGLPEATQRAMRRFEARYGRRRRAAKPRKRLTDKDIERVAKIARAVTPWLLKPAAQALAARASVVPFARAAAYQVVGLEFARRHNVRLPVKEWPMSLYRSLAGLNRNVYEAMWGPSEFFGTGTLAEHDRTARLHEIDLPTLVINGRYDSITPKQGEILANRIPGAEIVVFEESSHTSHMEERESYLAVLSRFLDGADSDGR